MMNRHWKRGFQTNVKNDLYHVEDQLQAYDPDLYLMYNPETNEHLIMDKIMEIAVMRIPQNGFEVLDSRVVDYMKKIHTASGFSAAHELKDMEERRLKEEQRKQDDMIYNMGKDTQKSVRQLAYYGA
jgi:hypothetical protein